MDENKPDKRAYLAPIARDIFAVLSSVRLGSPCVARISRQGEMSDKEREDTIYFHSFFLI